MKPTLRSGLVLLCAAAPVILGFSGPDSTGQGDQPAYGKTPKELLPYHQFKEPYKRFFVEPQPFLGSGREEQPPPGLETVKIGFLGPLEGSPDAPLGRRMLQGATLALEQANEAGGYDGLPFELVTRNDVGLWGASSNEIVRLHEAKVWGLLGSIDGASTHIVLRVALKLELPIVNTGSTDPTLTETRIPWMVRCTADDRQYGYALAFQIIKERGFERIAVLRDNNRYGRTGTIEIRDAAKRLGRPLLFELRYTTGDTTFAAQLERIRRASVQAVVLWGNAREAGLIVQQMRESGMQQAVFGADRLVSEEFLRTAGPAAEGVVATYAYDPTRDDPRLLAFRRQYHQRFGEEPEAFAAHAYDGMTLLLEAIRSAGLNRARIRDALAGVKAYRGVIGEIVFDATQNDVGSIWMAEVRDGEFHYFPSPLSRE